MSAKVFFDTNVLLYAHDRHDPAKQRRALDLIATHGVGIVVSTQVLQEFFVGATCKLGIPDLEAKEIIRAWSRFEVVGIDPSRINEAIDIRILNRLSFWDALILAAASSAQCATLLSEDLNNGQIIDGVRVENPFAR
jgi:predicted nucleic acid-binding protein